MKIKVCKKSELKEGQGISKQILARRIAVFLINGEYYAIEEKWAKLKTYRVAEEDDWLVVDLSA